MEQIGELIGLTGFARVSWEMTVMWAVSLGFFYLAVYHRFEPLLLIPIGFGALLANLPTEGLVNLPLGDHPGLSLIHI